MGVRDFGGDNFDINAPIEEPAQGDLEGGGSVPDQGSANSNCG